LEKAFNHNQSQDAEQQYDRLRDSAREQLRLSQKYAGQVVISSYTRHLNRAYICHQNPGESRKHAQESDRLNKQASEFIFRENNAVGRVGADTIDLHGQFVNEGREIVVQRIRYAKSTGQTRLHVIVGKGNHSANHIQKIKPMVEEVCQQEGLSYHTEANEGRIYVDLTGGQAQSPNQWPVAPGQTTQSQQQYGQPIYQTAYPMGQQPDYSEAHPDFDVQAQVKKYLPVVLRLCQKECCIVM